MRELAYQITNTLSLFKLTTKKHDTQHRIIGHIYIYKNAMW